MGFLDNLEDSLKTLETGDERELERHTREKRESDRAAALAVAPWAERLKNASFTQALLSEAASAGHRSRTKVYIAWIGNVLRLEARARKLELRPSSGGIHAVFLENNTETVSYAIDLEGDPAPLIRPLLDTGNSSGEPSPE